MASSEEEWSEEQFRAGVETNLRNGTFTLIIAVDLLNDELKRIVEYLNSRGFGAPTVAVLQMRQFQEGDTQLLVPQVFGTSTVKPPPPAGKMTEEQFLQGATDTFLRLYGGFRELTGEEMFRTSDFTKHGYSLRFLDKGPVAVLYPNALEMWLQTTSCPEFIDKAAYQRFWETVSEIPAFKPKMGLKNPGVTVSDDTWSPADVETFLTAIRSVVLVGSIDEPEEMARQTGDQ